MRITSLYNDEIKYIRYNHILRFYKTKFFVICTKEEVISLSYVREIVRYVWCLFYILSITRFTCQI